MQRVVTVAGNSVVGTQGGRLNGPCYRREEGYPWAWGTRGGTAQRKKMAVGGEKALQIGKKSFIINGFCNKL
jgi:hypothetical protein